MKIRFNVSAALAMLGVIAFMLVPRSVRADDAKPGPIKALPWLHEGLQITYYDKFATIMGAVNGIRDPRDLLNLPPAAEGQVQVTVAKIDGDTIVLSGRPFLADRQGPPFPLEDIGSIGPATKTLIGAHPWLDQDMLTTYLKTPAVGIEASRGPIKLNDKTVDVYLIKTSGNDFQNFYTYDANSGLLLHHNGRSLVPGLKATAHGLVNRTDEFVQFRDFVAMRDIKVPWANEPAPEWVGKVKALHYGVTTVVQTGFQPFVTQDQEDITITARGNGWIKGDMIFQNKTHVPMPNRAWGNAQFNGLWAGPAALATLKEGDVLDEDPITHIKTVVSKVDDNSVIITQSSPAIQIDFQYDKHNGIVASMHRVGGMPRTETTMRLLGTE